MWHVPTIRVLIPALLLLALTSTWLSLTPATIPKKSSFRPERAGTGTGRPLAEESRLIVLNTEPSGDHSTGSALGGLIGALNQRSSRQPVPSFLREHEMYDESAKRAMIDLATWLNEHDIPVPLFKDRLLHSVDEDRSPRVCVSIASARRKGSPFSSLVQAVSAILNRMDFAKHHRDVYIHVFNVDGEPLKHSEAKIVEYFVPVTELKVPIEQPPGFPIDPHYHENLDTAFIMREFSRINCEHSILLEDDSLATTNWMDSVNLALQQLKSRDPSSWLMVRLYSAHSSYPPLPWRGINDYDPMFNMVACLINKKYMLTFADELEANVALTLSKRDHKLNLPKDLVAEEFKQEHHVRILSFEPVIFQHTGVYSSISNRTVDAESVKLWPMFSEYFDAKGVPVIFNSTLWAKIV